MAKRLALLVLVATLVLAACGDDDAATNQDTTTTTAATTTTASTTTTADGTPPASEIVFEAQESDGTNIVVASVTLPSPGFIAVHANADGGPGPVIGHSDLLPTGTSTDVTVTLDSPLTETDLVFPMVHIDVDADGEYDFMPPDETTDAPGQTADGEVAVTGAEVTVTDTSAAPALIEIEGFDFGDPITVSVGTEVLVRNLDAAPHTWTSTDGVFDSGSLGANQEFTFTFDSAGEYDFFCAIHPAMTGTITVTG